MPCPYCSAKAASSFGKPKSCARGQTAAISAVVRPGRTREIAALVRVVHGARGVTNRETPVVAGAVSHVGVQDVVVHGIAGAQQAIGEHVGMRVAALARNGVDRLHVFRAQIVEDLAHQSHGLVLAQTGPHGAIQLVVGGVHHRGGHVQQRDLVLGLDQASLRHERLAVDHPDAFLL
jgi:hypothetical protein